MSWLRTAVATHTGYLRTANQDLALGSADLAVVADGMGGHLGGEIAARVAVEELLAAFERDRTTDGLIAAVRVANDAVYRRSRSDRNVRGMGTTLTAAALVGDEPDGQLRLALVNVGDSRGYLVDRQERRVLQLTEDHSVVEEMVRNGELTPAEAAVHPHRHVLTCALGIEPGIEPDCWELDLEPGSRLLLCSDGLTNELDEQEIAEVLLDEPNIDKSAAQLVRLALRRGGTDNITVVVLDVLAGERPEGSDEVIVVPAAAPGAAGSPAAASPAGTPEITEAIAVLPGENTGAGAGAGAGGGAGAGPSAGAGAGAGAAGTPPGPTGATLETAQIPVAEDAPRVAHSRPLLLVPKEKRERGQQRDRIVTFRVVLFVLLFAAVLGGTAGVVVWYNQAGFFVGIDHGEVTIFQGRPGGILWFKPAVVERTGISSSGLFPLDLPYLRQGVTANSYEAARHFVHDILVQRASETTTTTTTSTTTTLPPVTTTTIGGGTPPLSVTTTTVPATTTTTTTTTSRATTTTTVARSTTTTTGANSTTTTTRAKK